MDNPPERMPTPSDKAWAAGFFDGEGYVGHSRHTSGNKGPSRDKRYRCVSVQVTQNDPRVLERFREIVGVGVVGGPYYSDKRRNRQGLSPMFKFHTSGLPSVTHIYDCLYDFLSPVKRQQFEKSLLWFYASPVGSSTPV